MHEIRKPKSGASDARFPGSILADRRAAGSEVSTLLDQLADIPISRSRPLPK